MISKLIIKVPNKIKPYYKLTIGYAAIDEYQPIEHKFDKNRVDKYFAEFMGLIKMIYIYHYSSPDTKGAMGFNHIKDLCFYDDFNRSNCYDDCRLGKKKCKYFQNADDCDHDRSRFWIDIPLLTESVYDEGHYRIEKLSIEYFDEKSCVLGKSAQADFLEGLRSSL